MPNQKQTLNLMYAPPHTPCIFILLLICKIFFFAGLRSPDNMKVQVGRERIAQMKASKVKNKK
jgi:hypothetical protein